MPSVTGPNKGPGRGATATVTPTRCRSISGPAHRRNVDAYDAEFATPYVAKGTMGGAI